MYNEVTKLEEYEDDLTILPVKPAPTDKKIKHHPTLQMLIKGLV